MRASTVVSRLRTSELVRHGSFVFGGVAVAAVFNYLYYMLIGRRAGVDVYGVIASLISAMLVVAIPATVGQLIAARLAADLAARNDRPALRRLTDVLTIWTTSIAAVVVGLGIVFRGALAGFFNMTDSMPIVVITLALGAFAVVSVQRGVLQGSQQFGDFAISSSIDSIFKVVIGVPLVATLGASGGLLGILVGVLFALAYDVYAFRARFGSRRAPLALDRALIVRVISHVGLGQLTFTVLTFYDVPLIKHAFDAHSAGVYSAAALVGRAVVSAISFVPTLVMPKATARLAAGRSPLPLLGLALAIAGGIVAIAAVAAVLAPHFIVTLIAGRAFGDAAALVFLYVIASGALSLANVVAAYQIGLHNYRFVVPALVAAVGEITVLIAWHPSLQAAVSVLAAGHLCVFLVTLAFIRRSRSTIVVGAA